MSGSWAQSDATTPLPDVLGGGDLNIDATLDVDGMTAPQTFNLLMTLEFSGLVDTIEVEGTYEDDGENLTLTFTGFVIDPASGNSQFAAEDGSQCILLTGFADTPVCFPSSQTNPFTVGNESLTIILDHSIAGAELSQTNLTLTRSL